MCEYCPVVAGLVCERCGRYNPKTDGTVRLFAPCGAMLEVAEDEVVTTVVIDRPTVRRGEHSQKCGGGRRILRKKIGAE